MANFMPCLHLCSLPPPRSAAQPPSNKRSTITVNCRKTKVGDGEKHSKMSELGFKYDRIFRPLYDHSVGLGSSTTHSSRGIKISFVGTGNVGMAVVHTVLNMNLADEIALVAVQPEKLRGATLDLQHGAAFIPRVRIISDVNLAVTKDSHIIVVTAGACMLGGESRLDLLQKNLDLFRMLIPTLADYSPNSLILVVTNPVDILTYAAWKLSGFPAGRVIGSGTNVDSARFKFLIADHFQINAQDVQAYVLGEHGDSSVLIWSNISIAGVPVMKKLIESHISCDEDALESIRQAVVGGGYEVLNLKGHTSTAVALSVVSVLSSIIRDQRRIQPVSVLARGFHSVDDDVFLSLPACLGRGGIIGVAELELTEKEASLLRSSAKKLWGYCKLLDF